MTSHKQTLNFKHSNSTIIITGPSLNSKNVKEFFDSFIFVVRFVISSMVALQDFISAGSWFHSSMEFNTFRNYQILNRISDPSTPMRTFIISATVTVFTFLSFPFNIQDYLAQPSLHNEEVVDGALWRVNPP